MRKIKEIDRSAFWLWAVFESALVAVSFVLFFIVQQAQIAGFLFGTALFSFFYRSLYYSVRKD